jgi:hypothetical protein
MDDAPFDHLLKLLLVGDSGAHQPQRCTRPSAQYADVAAGVGKSCLLLRFIDDVFEDVSPTIGAQWRGGAVAQPHAYVPGGSFRSFREVMTVCIVLHTPLCRRGLQTKAHRAEQKAPEADGVGHGCDP